MYTNSLIDGAKRQKERTERTKARVEGRTKRAEARAKDKRSITQKLFGRDVNIPNASSEESIKPAKPIGKATIEVSKPQTIIKKSRIEVGPSEPVEMKPKLEAKEMPFMGVVGDVEKQKAKEAMMKPSKVVTKKTVKEKYKSSNMANKLAERAKGYIGY